MWWFNRDLINTIDTTSGRATDRLSIDFGDSLRLLNFQDLIALLESCKRKRIIVSHMNFDKISQLFATAVQTSVDNKNDPRLLSNCKNVDGQPYTISILSLDNVIEGESGIKPEKSLAQQKVNGPRIDQDIENTIANSQTVVRKSSISSMLQCLIANDFDMNVTDSNDESVLFKLIQNEDTENISFLFRQYVGYHKHKLNLNYFNKQGESPLYQAIYNDTVRRNRNRDKIDVKMTMMYDILITNDIENACVNFPVKKNKDGTFQSSLAMALFFRQWDIAKRLIDRGAVLNASEHSTLAQTYLDMLLDDDGSGNFYLLNNLFEILLQQCDTSIDKLTDTNGNNPFHLLMQQLEDHFSGKSQSGRKASIVNNREQTIDSQENVDEGGDFDDDDGILQSADKIQAASNRYVNVIRKMLLDQNDWFVADNKDGNTAIHYLFELIFTQMKVSADKIDKLNSRKRYKISSNIDLLDLLIQQCKENNMLDKLCSAASSNENCVERVRMLLLRYHKYSSVEFNNHDLYISGMNQFQDCICSNQFKWKEILFFQEYTSVQQFNRIIKRVQQYLFKYFEYSIPNLHKREKSFVKSNFANHSRKRSSYSSTQSTQSRFSFATAKAKSPRFRQTRLVSVQSNSTNVGSDYDLDRDGNTGVDMKINEIDEVKEIKEDKDVDIVLHKPFGNDDEGGANVVHDGGDMIENLMTVQQGRLSLRKRRRKEKAAASWIEVVYIFTVESLSIADIATDVIILAQLFVDNKPWWTAATIAFMISPYLVSYTALGSIFLDRQKKSHSNSNNKCSKCTIFLKSHSNSNNKCTYIRSKCTIFLNVFFTIITITPVCLIYFIILDLVFMFYAIITTFLYVVTCSKIDIKDWFEKDVFQPFLKISRMELIGYRRLRTLAQLLFETFPTVILQLDILSEISSDNSGDGAKVSVRSLYLSLGFATLHCVMEMMILYLDCNACHLSFAQYAVICLNARLSWVPFLNLFGDSSSGTRNDKQVWDLNFEKIVSDAFCVNYQLDFEFSPMSLKLFTKRMYHMPLFAPIVNQDIKPNHDFSDIVSVTNISDRIEKRVLHLISQSNSLADVLLNSIGGINSDVSSHSARHKRIMKLKFGKHCCKNIGFTDFYQFYRNSYNKVKIDCGNMAWTDMMDLDDVRGTSTFTSDILDMMKILLQMGDISSCAQLLGRLTNLHKNGVSRDFPKYREMILQIIPDNLVPLQQYYNHKVLFGITCKESDIIYKYVYCLLKRQQKYQMVADGGNGDGGDGAQYFYLAMVLLWYTQRNISDHHCFECNKNWIEHIVDFESEYNYNSNGKITIEWIHEQIGKYLVYNDIKLMIFGSGSSKKKGRVHDDLVSEYGTDVEISLRTVELFDGLNHLFANYLLQQAVVSRVDRDNYSNNVDRRGIRNGCVLEKDLTPTKNSKVQFEKNTERDIVAAIKAIDEKVSGLSIDQKKINLDANVNVNNVNIFAKDAYDDKISMCEHTSAWYVLNLPHKDKNRESLRNRDSRRYVTSIKDILVNNSNNENNEKDKIHDIVSVTVDFCMMKKISRKTNSQPIDLDVLKDSELRIGKIDVYLLMSNDSWMNNEIKLESYQIMSSDLDWKTKKKIEFDCMIPQYFQLGIREYKIKFEIVCQSRYINIVYDANDLQCSINYNLLGKQA